MNFNHYLPDTENRVERLRGLVDGRTMVILLPAPSIKLLKDYMPILEQHDICYSTVNDYWVMENLFHPMDIVLRSAKECNVPCDKDITFLSRDKINMLLSERAGYHQDNMHWVDFMGKYNERILWFQADRSTLALTRPNEQFPLHFLAQASFALLVCFGIIGKAKQIILFGAEGVVDDKDIGAIGGWTTDVEPMSIRKQRLIYDTSLFRETMPYILRNVYRTYGLSEIPILNCSPYSHYGVFPLIRYEELDEQLV